ncbi:hypothetical protein F2P56_022298 [Juglans regia]|uniref:UPF0481 protein At3g47200-like isoform X1 n=2 Tax=Juglans regia TaxID=51240 RepID=A0A2I4ELN9_JUGRE|nr:UPF0481 protein At3g47200-like isoform X1 [Juglans regia]KAF5458256.1 hypothetical protein F2P56_022298 [Juglans regia]
MAESKRGVIRIDDIGETSQGRDQLVISVKEAQTQSGLVQSSVREERFELFEKEEISEVRTKSKTSKIQKVIFLLRDHKHFVKYYEPRVVSLGPIHHGKEKYQLAETFKLILAKGFVKSSGKTIKEICNKIEKIIKELRECFEEEVTKTYNDVDLAWILVVDGCAILQYIYLAVEGKLKELNIKQDSVAFCQQDLFLLENQVPYRLLEKLMSLSQMKEKLEKSIDKFIRINQNMVQMNQQSIKEQAGKSGEGKMPSQEQDGKSGEGKKPIQEQDGKSGEVKKPSQEQDGKSGEGKKPTHLLDLLRTSLLGPARKPKTEKQPSRTQQKNNPDWQSYDSQSYRNMQELIAAGIHVKRSEGNSLKDISFSRKFNFFPGFLSLPPLIVDDSTGPKFLNLIAYEMCLDFQNDFGITSYISFLDLLIDEANDVKVLRKARVLFNHLGSDEEVAKLFNEIGTDLVPNMGEYKNVKWQIQEYYDNRCLKWIGEFFHNHFSSPWTVLAFLGALFALALSATQTWYAVDSPPGPCDKFCEKFDQNLRKG